MRTIEERLEVKRKTGKWPHHPSAVEILDPPSVPPKTDFRFCPHCKEPLKIYRWTGHGYCRLCGYTIGFNPYRSK